MYFNTYFYTLNWLKIIIALLLITGMADAAIASGPQISAAFKSNFNSDWKFSKSINKSKDENIAQFDFDDSSWESISLPHTANIEPLLVNDQWQGICWYRKTFDCPEANDKKIFIEFEAAMNVAEIWLNGQFLTKHMGGYLPIVLDITDVVHYEDQNVIALKLDNRDNPLTGPKPHATLDFCMYGGLYRNAWLFTRNKTYITHPILADKPASGGVFVTTSDVSKESATVNIQTHLQNDATTDAEIHITQKLYFENVLVGSSRSERQTITASTDMESNLQISVENPKLWSPDFPHLYRLVTTVQSHNNIMDEQITVFGIRKIAFKDNQFYLNDEKLFLRGVNRHQDYPFIGYALSDNAHYRDAKKIKDAGFNFVRLSHYPHSPAFMRACDELGLLTLDAIMGWQYFNKDQRFQDYIFRASRDLIRRDRNHACVLAWEVSLNETNMPLEFRETLHNIAHEEYPGDQCFSAGWMEDGYDIYLQARQHRLRHYNEHQPKPYVVSEYGDWEYYAMNAGLNQDSWKDILKEERNSRQLRTAGEKRLLQQATNIQEAHNDNLKTPACADAYWVMYDYNRGYADDIEASGIMDIFRIPKFSYYFYVSQKSPSATNDPMVHIASYWQEDSPLDVRVFSNCEEVALYMDNKLVARQQPDRNRMSENLNHPPFTFNIDKFESGTLRAVGFLNDEQVIEHSVTTPGHPIRLQLELDRSGREPQARCNDVIFVYIKLVDENGTIVRRNNETVKVTIDGDAKIINPSPIQTEAGIATVLLQIGSTEGPITINAKVPDIQSGVLTFDITSRN